MEKHEDGVVGGWAGARLTVWLGCRLLLNECVDKVFSNQTGGVFSLNITGQ
jgi:hypothetical protein